MVKAQLNRLKPPSSPTMVGMAVAMMVLSTAAMKVAMRQAMRTRVRERDPSARPSPASAGEGEEIGEVTNPARLSRLGGDLVERDALVGADVGGQAEHALGDDVAEDFVGAALDPHRGRAHEDALEARRRLGPRRVEQDAGLALQVEREHGDLLQHR